MQIPWALILGFAGAVCLWIGSHLLGAHLRGLGARKRGRRAIAAEARGADLLRRAGYRVVDHQVPLRWEIALDRNRVGVDLRADYVVRKRGRLYVAEVKSGRLAPRIDNARTRRQLLEYAIAFGTDGALLVDAEAGRVHRVVFPLRRAGLRGAWLAIAIVAGFLLAAVLVLGTRG